MRFYLVGSKIYSNFAAQFRNERAVSNAKDFKNATGTPGDDTTIAADLTARQQNKGDGRALVEHPHG